MDDQAVSAGVNQTLPVLEERLEIEIRQNVTGIVRLEKKIHQSAGLVDQELVTETLSVEHIPVNQYIDEPALSRQEGDVTIYPVMEEVLIVTKQLVLKEEIRITRQRTRTRYQEVIPLMAEDISFERLPRAPRP